MSVVESKFIEMEGPVATSLQGNEVSVANSLQGNEVSVANSLQGNEVSVQDKDYDSDGVKTVISRDNDFFKQLYNDKKEDLDCLALPQQEGMSGTLFPGNYVARDKSKSKICSSSFKKQNFYKCLPCFYMSKKGRCDKGDSCTYIHYQDELCMNREQGLSRDEYVKKHFNNFQRSCYYNLSITRNSSTVKNKVWKKVEKSIENCKYKKISIFVDKSDLNTYMKVLSILKGMKEEHKVKIEY